MDRSTALRTPRPAEEVAFQPLLDGFRARLDRELAAFLAKKREAAAGAPEALELVDGVARLVAQGGKRLRPALVCAAYRACGGRREEAVLPLALSTELLHTYLLIHDDIMDHAEVRRGEPAAHVRFADAHLARGWRGDAGDFGRSAAILVGDLAHTWAVELFAEAGEGVADPERRRALRGAFSAMAEEVIAGQYLEIQVGLRPRAEGATEEELLRVLRLKSGRYTAAPARGAPRRGIPRAPRAPRPLRRRGRRSLPAPGRPAGDLRRRRDGRQAGRRRPARREVHLPRLPRPPRRLAGAAPGAGRRPRRRRPDAAAPRGRPPRARGDGGPRPRRGDGRGAPPNRRRRPRRPAARARGLRLPRRPPRLALGARAVTGDRRAGRAVAPWAAEPDRDRKAEHIRLALEGRMQGGGGYFDQYRFEHQALPELDFDEIDLSTTFLGKHLAAPLLVSCMTGGTEIAARINRHLALGAERVGLALGVGSQRKALEDRTKADTFRVRNAAPSVPLLANLGAVQLNYGVGLAECEAVVAMIGADALAFHLNPLQEAIQPEGQRDFRGLVAKLGEVARALSVPAVAKEIGSGLSAGVAQALHDEGFRIFDTAGSGGTSWARIEGERARDPELGEVFADWGIPTPESIRALAELPGITLIGSGGVRNGVDAAKAIALGADLVGLAYPFLEAASESAERVVERAERVVRELKIAMFCLGARDLAALKAAKLQRRNEP